MANVAGTVDAGARLAERLRLKIIGTEGRG